MLIRLFSGLMLFACTSEKVVQVRNATPSATITSHSDGDVVLAGPIIEFQAALSDEDDPANDHEGKCGHRPGKLGKCCGHAQQLEADQKRGLTTSQQMIQDSTAGLPQENRGGYDQTCHGCCP